MVLKIQVKIFCVVMPYSEWRWWVLWNIGILYGVAMQKTSAWMYLAQDRDQWWALMSTVMNIQIL